MDKLIIPGVPDSLYFTVNKMWDGSPCGDERLHAEVWITKKEAGLNVRVHATILDGQKIPNAPVDTRFDGLWDYDVVELFFVGADGKYTEVEVGAGGHYLVLAFDDVRIRANDFAGREFDHRHGGSTPGTWQTQMTIPWDVLPSTITRMNAFAIMGGTHLALSAVPGSAPDFHQPATFPEAEVAA